MAHDDAGIRTFSYLFLRKIFCDHLVCFKVINGFDKSLTSYIIALLKFDL